MNETTGKTTATTTTIQIDLEVKAAIVAQMKGQETYNDVLRRVMLQNGHRTAD